MKNALADNCRPPTNAPKDPIREEIQDFQAEMSQQFAALRRRLDLLIAAALSVALGVVVAAAAL